MNRLSKKAHVVIAGPRRLGPVAILPLSTERKDGFIAALLAMTSLKNVCVSLLILFGLLLSPTVGFADKLSTSFVDVVVLDVPLGVPHTVEDRQGHGILLRNSGEKNLSAVVRVLVPTPSELRGGASPIPDPSWIRITPEEVLIPAGEEAECRVALSVPKERRFRHKYYQAMIWTQAKPVGQGGLQIRAGLKSRLRFRTSRK